MSEAKLVLGDNLVISLATEFIENPKANAGKQDCELTSFKRLEEAVKKEYPRLLVCLLTDRLSASESVFQIYRND